MESKELNLNNGCKDGDGFIDRSKVRILLCDSDMESCDQVTQVRSARQMIHALNAEGPEIDIILAEVEMTKGMKMLKYIMRNKELGRIPVVSNFVASRPIFCVMSAKDEVSIVVNCLRLGAADYLLKPLRSNELLNLWTHMWRRGRMLGLADKNILNYGIELIASDHSDANTISSTLFSDDTDDNKSQKSTNPEMGVSMHQEDDESAAAAVEPPPQTDSSEFHPGISDCRTGRLLSDDPKKSEQKIGGSSAFFSYVKLNAVTNGTQVTDPNDENAANYMIIEENRQLSDQQAINDAGVRENQGTWDSFLFAGRSSTLPVPIEGNFKEEFSQPRNEPQPHAYPYYTSGVLNQVTTPSSSAHLFLNNLHDLRNHAKTSAPPRYNHLQQYHSHPHVSGMVASFPYYPVNMMLTAHSLPTVGNSSSGEKKVDRREAALVKFRQKRKMRCFDKKIRYANRKSLADRRLRVRGQFASKVNGVTIDFNGQPASEDEEDKERESLDYSHEDDIPGS